MIAITDHGPAMYGGAPRYHFGNMDVIPRQIEGVYIPEVLETTYLMMKGTLDL